MNKLLAMFAAVALVFAALPLAALAALGDAILLRSGAEGEYGSPRALAEADGTVYMLADAVYTLAEGEDEFVRHELALNPDAAGLWEEDALDGETVMRHEAITIIAYEERPCLVVAGIANEYYADGETMGHCETVEGVWLYELTFDGEGRAALGAQIVELEWDDLIYASGDFEELAGIFLPFVMDGTLYLKSYDAGDNEILVATNLASGATELLYAADLTGGLSIEGMCAYKDGKILCETVAWGEPENAVALYALDFGAETLEPLAEFACPSADYPSGLAYRAESDTLYFAMNRETHAMPGIAPESMQAVAEIPVGHIYRATPVLTEDGFYIAADSEAAVRRNTDPALRTTTRLTVQNGYAASLDNAYYAFMNRYGDVEVVLTDSAEDLVQAMLGRSAAVDVYCVDVQSLGYDAAFSRGYMPAIQSDAVSAFVKSCYPFVQEACVKDGQVVAVPVEIYLQSGLGYNPGLLEQLGLSPEDLPGTWAEFFASLEPLAQKVAEVPGASLFAGDDDSASLPERLFGEMMNNYAAYIARPENEFAFDTPTFRTILEAYEGVHWDALGLPLPEEDGWEGEMGASGEMSMAVSAAPVIDADSSALFSMDAYTGADGYTAMSGYDALPLAIGEGAQPQTLASLLVAFVNPYSEHPEEATAFLETLVEEMDGVLKIEISPQNNAPLPKPHYQQELAAYDEQIAMLQKRLETADAQERPALEARIAQYGEQREQYALYDGWQASEESIGRYRAVAESIVLMRNIGLGSGNEEAYYTQMQQYLDGASTAGEFAAGMDRQLQMMMKEGA